MHIQKVIEQFGYTPNEARVYLTVLHKGECTIADIAATTTMPRTSVKVIVDALHKDGLLNYYVKKRYKYWIAESPEKLLARLRERETALRSVLPDLNALRHQSGAKPIVKIYSGPEEIKLIFEDIIATKHNILGISPWEDWIKLLGENFVNDFTEQRASHFLHIKLLVGKSANSSHLKAHDENVQRETRFIPERIKISSATFIYANKVAIISLNKKLPTAVLIEDPDVSHTMTVFFNELWELSS